jgi:hypothetical protein
MQIDVSRYAPEVTPGEVEPGSATPLKLWLHSWRFLLTDSTGATVDHFGAQFPLQLSTTGIAPSYTFNIAGEAAR